MSRCLFSVLFLSAMMATASADPFEGLAAHGYSLFSASVTGNSGNVSDSGSEDKSGDTSFYAGVGRIVSMSNAWDYTYDVYIGTDENGDAVFQTITEPQGESGSAQANAYARFDRGGNAISAEVYAFTSTESMYSGSQAFVSADAYAYSSMELTFSLTGWTPVQLFTSTYYDNANLTLWRDGKFVLDSSNLYGLGTFSTTLAPGNYTLIGEAIYGGADLTIQAAPEPASLAALGLGLLALKRRRR